jgi:hypothetical protein
VGKQHNKKQTKQAKQTKNEAGGWFLVGFCTCAYALWFLDLRMRFGF